MQERKPLGDAILSLVLQIMYCRGKFGLLSSLDPKETKKCKRNLRAPNTQQRPSTRNGAWVGKLGVWAVFWVGLAIQLHGWSRSSSKAPALHCLPSRGHGRVHSSTSSRLRSYPPPLCKDELDPPAGRNKERAVPESCWSATGSHTTSSLGAGVQHGLLHTLPS